MNWGIDSSHGQIRTRQQLADSIVKEFQVFARGQQKVVVRELRVPEGVDHELTDLLKQQLQSQGISPALSAAYEIEGRFKNKRAGTSVSRVFEVKIINPQGYDHTREFSVPVTWSSLGETDIPIDSQPISPSAGHQIYPIQEWKHYRLPADAVNELTNGFITSESSWRRFWAKTGSLSPLPYVDFREQVIRVETAPYPRTISASIYSAGEGRVDLKKDISSDPIEPGGNLNAHVLLIRISEMGERRGVRFGVTVDPAQSGRGVVITSTVPNSPVTRGWFDDGRSVQLEAGDVILSINGIRTDAVSTFAEIIRNTDSIIRVDILDVRTGNVISANFRLE
ncbi:MAG TPA: hypothetical protein PKD64_12750 [Pirellulaceae bacterium]|nr:hypothetical protein [Pirellulaceae bacterium]HMO93056.1 hypothetical protein [Pirellulaceae bacterium]